MLKRIAGYLGVVLKVDEATLSKTRMSFTRVLVEMNVEDNFLEELYFSNEDDEIITQPVQYDWIPIWCSKCSQYSHSVGDCRLGKQLRSKPQLEVDDDGFRRYKKGFKRVVPTDPK